MWCPNPLNTLQTKYLYCWFYFYSKKENCDRRFLPCFFFIIMWSLNFWASQWGRLPMREAHNCNSWRFSMKGFAIAFITTPVIIVIIPIMYFVAYTIFCNSFCKLPKPSTLYYLKIFKRSFNSSSCFKHFGAILLSRISLSNHLSSMLNY